MPTVSKIPQAEWDKHKDRLYAMYITEDRQLEEVVERAKLELGFFASKAQYIRQFGKGKWDFKKNFRKEEWKAVSQEVSKRKFRDKDSEVWLKDSLVPSKRLRKEISRYGLHTHNQHDIGNTFDASTLKQENSLDASSGIVVRTPQAETRTFINYMHIPWIHFLDFTEPYIQSFRRSTSRGSPANASQDLVLQLHKAWSVWIARQHGNDLTSVSQNDSQLQVASLQHDMWDDSINHHSDLQSNLQDSVDTFCPPLDNFTPSHLSSLTTNEADSCMMMIEPSIRAFSLLADNSNPLTEVTSRVSEKQVRTYQEDLAIGMRDRDPKTVIPGSSESLIRLISFLAYLSSNSLLETELDPLVRWLHDSGMEMLLWQMLDLKLSTTEIFGSMIFRSAAKLGFTEMVQKLIDKGVDVNSVEGDSFTRETALRLAVTHNQIEVVRLLLQAGADPMRHEYPYTSSILHRALDGSNRIEMMRLLIDHGADVNDDFHSGDIRVLRYAIQQRYHAIARILLKAGAYVNANNIVNGWYESEPLHVAVENDDVEMVQILIDAGEDINGRARRFPGNIYKRLDAGQHPEILASPIQLASLANNVELVQMFLHEDADPCRDVRQDTYVDDDEARYKYVPTALQSAVHHRNAVTVRMLLEAHADVNDRTGHLGPPLAIAAANADLKIVRVLLRHGSHINAPAENFRESATALQAAVKTGDLDVVQELLDNGADVNADAGPIIGRTALQAAAEEGNLEMVKFLITLRADVNADPGLEMGVTCLQAAVSQGHVDLALFLLDNGAFVNGPAAAETGGVTALQAALKLFTKDSDCQEIDKAKDHSRFALLTTLLNAGADPNSPCSPNKAPSTLTIAVLSGRLDLVHFLLERGLNPNTCVSYRSPLGEAVAQDDINLVRCLINARTDVDAWYEIESHCVGGPDLFRLWDFGGTPLHVAAFKGNVEIAGLLLDAGAEIGVIHFYDRFPSHSALQWAVEGSCAKMVKYLLDRGAHTDVYTATASLPPHKKSSRFSKFFSPLEQAFLCLFERPEYLEIIAALLNAGADPNPTPGYRCGEPESFFERAALEPDAGPELIQLLLRKGASVNWTCDGTTALQSVAKRNRTDMVEVLLNAGADANAPAGPHEDDRTALQHATILGNLEMVKLLLSHGADMNAPAVSYYGRTALQKATELGSLEMVKLLLSNGAEVNAPAGHKGGITALQGAMREGSLKIVLTLLEAGANINDAPAAVDGRTALEAAAEWGRLDIVHLLLNNDSEPDTIEARCERAAQFAEYNYHSTIARDLRQHRPSR